MVRRFTKHWLLAMAVGVLAGVVGAPQGASATTVDLTTAGATGEINGALFFQIDEAPGGSGVIDSFVRIQDATHKGDFVDGVNTSARPLCNDEKNGGGVGSFTHDLLLSDVGIVSYGGLFYREFFLDFNEAAGPGDENLLSMDRVKIYLTDTVYLTNGMNSEFDDSDPSDNGPFSAAQLIYDLDALEDSWVKLDFDLDSGSGEVNMRMLVPNELFVGGDYLYLYSAFGEQGGSWANSDGFEEWYAGKGAPPVPEPATFLLLGSGLIGLIFFRRRQAK